MNPVDLAPLLRAMATELDAIDVPYAVVGGLAVGVWTNPRFTKDVDFAITVASDADAEQIIGALHRRGFALIQELDNQRTGRLATARMCPPRELRDEGEVEALVDLLFMTCGIEPEVVAEARVTEVLTGAKLPTARIPHLLAMKSISAVNPHRLMDKQDMAWLAAEATPQELQRARELMDLITERGYNPGHDLHALLDEAIKLAEMQRDQPY